MYLRWIDRLNKVLKIFLVASLTVMLIALFLQVVLRYLFNYSLSWTAELSRYLMIWITFVGAAIAVRHNRLIKVEILLLKMPPGMKKGVQITAAVISFAFYILLIVYGISILQTVKGQHSSALQLSMAIPYAAIPVGALLMLGNTIAAILDRGKGARES